MRTLVSLFVCLVAFPALGETRVIDLPPARVLLLAPPTPRATIVMLPGGTGRIGITRTGDIRDPDNFTVRTANLWNARGDAVLIPDAIDQQNERDTRSTPAFASWVATLVATAHAQTPGVPVYLLGTSQGTIAAVNGASHAPPGTIAGVILTESVSRPGRRSRETVFDAAPTNIRVPALVVANLADACDVAPPADAARIAALIPHARLLTVTGGDTLSADPCSSRTPHGEWGIAPRVVTLIATWIANHR